MKETKVVVVDIEKEVKEETEKKLLLFIKTNPNTGDQSTFDNMQRQVEQGMKFLRDREMMRRITQGQQIRVFNLISTDAKELKEYIQVTMPSTIPKLGNE